MNGLFRVFVRCSMESISRVVQAQVNEKSCSTTQSSVDAGPRWIFWPPPPTNVLKANFDPSMWPDGQGTLACVVRNCEGKLLCIAR